VDIQRHRPEQSTLYRLAQQDAATFLKLALTTAVASARWCSPAACYEG